jgi:protein phosphatase PTC7
MKLFGGSEHYAEKPTDADLYQHRLTHGDVLVFATDGVWDNLSPEDALRIVSGLMVKFQGWTINEDDAVRVSSELTSLAKAADSKVTTKESVTGLATYLATAITREAKEASLNKRRDGPFAKEVRRHFPGENYNGGKPDDICTVVAVVLEDGH